MQSTHRDSFGPGRDAERALEWQRLSGSRPSLGRETGLQAPGRTVPPLWLSATAIEEARTRIADAIEQTPCISSHVLSEQTGGQVFLKLENFQRTGSFKERGALNGLLNLTAEERARGVIAASAGNHAQAVAYHASRLGIPSTIVMPVGSPTVKVERTRAFGATVHLAGATYDDAFSAAREMCEREGQVYVHAYDNRHVITGQGTIGLELLEQQPALDVVVVPIGGGGLASGVAVALKDKRPEISLVGVQAARVPSMIRALEQGTPTLVPPASTRADGIAVRRVGQDCLEICAKFFDRIVTVEEAELEAAVLHLIEHERTVAEGSGAAAVAALLHGKVGGLEDKKVVAIISGGNIDPDVIAKIIREERRVDK